MFNKKINFDKFISITNFNSFVDVYYQIQTSLISNGTKLEKQIRLAIENKSKEGFPVFVISDLNLFFDKIEDQKDGKYIVFTKEIKISKYIISNNNKKINTDCIIIEKNQNNLQILVSEIKSGSELDTKKSKAERDKLILTIEKLKEKIFNTDNFNISFKFLLISFFEKNKEAIYLGLKKEFNMEEIITGEEFCLFFDISYYDLLELKIENNKLEKNDTDIFLVEKILKEFMKIENLTIKKIIKDFCIKYLEKENH